MNPNGERELKASEPIESPVATVPRWHALRRLWRAQTIYVVALAAFAVLAIFAYFNPYIA